MRTNLNDSCRSSNMLAGGGLFARKSGEIVGLLAEIYLFRCLPRGAIELFSRPPRLANHAFNEFFPAFANRHVDRYQRPHAVLRPRALILCVRSILALKRESKGSNYRNDFGWGEWWILPSTHSPELTMRQSHAL